MARYRACQAVKDIVDPLSKKGFVWGLIHQDKIDKQINVAQSKITDVFGLFNVSRILCTSTQD